MLYYSSVQLRQSRHSHDDYVIGFCYTLPVSEIQTRCPQVCLTTNESSSTEPSLDVCRGCWNAGSSSTLTLVVPPTRLFTAGDRAFPVAAARTWNSLSRSLTLLSSLASFRRQLKTELFIRSFPDLDSSAYDCI